MLCPQTFSEKLTVYEILWRNIVERGTAQMAIWSMRIACWIRKVTNTHSQYVVPLLSHYTNGCTNAPQYYVTRTLRGIVILLLLPIALRPFQFGLGFLMVSEQYSFTGWGCQPHAHPQLSWRTDDFLSGLSPLAGQSRF